VNWLIADAKNKFSELVTRALSEGPQRVTRYKEAVIVISEVEYHKLIGKGQSFKDFLANGPDFEKLDLTRDRSTMRDVKL